MKQPTNNNGNSHQNQHDGQQNYQNSNHRNPDNVRNDTQKHHYKDLEDTLKNDANYDPDTQEFIGDVDADFDDKNENEPRNEGSH